MARLSYRLTGILNFQYSPAIASRKTLGECLKFHDNRDFRSEKSLLDARDFQEVDRMVERTEC